MLRSGCGACHPLTALGTTLTNLGAATHCLVTVGHPPAVLRAGATDGRAGPTGFRVLLRTEEHRARAGLADSGAGDQKRDVRLLRDALLAYDDWEVAGRAYAAGHDRGYATIHTTEDLFTTLFLETGPEADARRARALPLISEEPDRVPDAFMAGPDAAPTDQSARMRFFGET